MIFTEGDVGFRWVSQNDWILGAVGRINTQGTGANAIQDLLGLDGRNWVVELSPVGGWRRWPVHLEMRHYVEVFSDTGGPATELRASWPHEYRRGWVVPSIRYIRNSSERNRYYYGISANEIPGLNSYVPGSSSHVMANLDVGFAITDKWLLS
ncbi:MAG: MipA/OmpV family protein, partial [Woeseiaceae bacterium]